ncbi:acetyltransferase [Streptomyces sp. NBRC 110611]|uniref:choline/carnitine O-acyltransferase n=1 Tax=Streptomyces sp. NBRC 110611 TaxID=1621259 RepID=UPI0008303B2B|nr:choline/carnitine O-acyltransferase [Streptomyces sp. NBRC 110611]GAU69487.1 acetyltransferase [Streptomyces sp. NBRC 110611]
MTDSQVAPAAPAAPTPPPSTTFALEDSLPRVPLPALDDTCERFLAWCAPLLTSDELAATKAEVAAFLRPDGPGRDLQAALQEYDATPGVHSWLDTFWPYRYLGRRDRIALNANFFFLFQDTGQPQLPRAAGLIAAALHYKHQLDRELIPPVIQRGQPQSMEQNTFLFSTTRIPGPEQDTVRAPYSEAWPGPSDARHIVVFFRGTMYKLDVLGADGAPHNLDELENALRTIVHADTGATQPTGPDTAPNTNPGPTPNTDTDAETDTSDTSDASDTSDTSVGHLTTMARAEWAAAREALLSNHPANAAALDDIETALFCLSLEDFAPADTQQACDELLYGDRGNRWFDKAVTFIVFADGRAGINVEHCGLDGTTILSFVDTLLATPAEEHSRRSGAHSQGLPVPKPLTFHLDEALRAQVRAAAESFAQYGAETATQTVSFDDFGAATAKSLRISPDAFVQLAYQLAHQRAKGHLGATYESIATRQWRGGRTEAMRVVTPEIVDFVSAMQDPATGPDARRAALRAAARAHVTRAKECQAGDAPEQHLWELELIQRRRGPELGIVEQPALYRTPGWLTLRDDYLSTSSAPSAHIQYFGFGSTSSRCIGVAYVLLPDRFHVYLSTPRPVATQMHTFAHRLREAVHELRDLLTSE